METVCKGDLLDMINTMICLGRQPDRLPRYTLVTVNVGMGMYRHGMLVEDAMRSHVSTDLLLRECTFDDDGNPNFCGSVALRWPYWMIVEVRAIPTSMHLDDFYWYLDSVQCPA